MMTNRLTAPEVLLGYLTLLLALSSLPGCVISQPSQEEEMAIASQTALDHFMKEEGCEQAEVLGTQMETHKHTRWIGRESLRIYRVEVKGCIQRKVISITCVQDRGCVLER